ncbi:MAG TPA: sulfatase-like hydrolase/transferase [Solirubrobacteraceae bacterium]|nr:sulfatase-like hydrolase/transferase [Solirubrobacteraceae bacterium]
MRSTGRNRLTRRDLIRYGGAGAAGAAALAGSGCDLSDGSASDDSPVPRVTRDRDAMNVLLIVTDSTRRDFVSAYGGDELADTPSLDALAKEGLRFDRAVPEAMPTVAVRRALLTGTRSFPFRDWRVAPKLPKFPGWSPIPAHKRLVTEYMDMAGVETAYVTDNPFLIGPRFERFRKTLDISAPIYEQGEYRSWNVGIDEDRVASKQQIENYLLPALQGTGAEKRLQENIGFNRGRRGDQLSGARVLKEGMRALRKLKDKQPFFLGVDAFDPHEAWNVPTTFLLRFEDHEGVEPILPFKTPYSKVQDLEVTEEQVQRVRELYAAELTYIDAWIGRLLNLLDDLRLADSTVVYYLSDHGILLGEHGLMGKANSMLGKEIHDVPYMIRHPLGTRAGDTTDFFASTHDVAPTVLSFQGITVPGRMDGDDLTVMFDGADPPERPFWTTCYADHVAAGDGRYLLIAGNQGEEKRLFDTQEDPDEEDDVASDNPDVVDRLWKNIVDDAGGTMPVFGKTGVISG